MEQREKLIEVLNQYRGCFQDEDIDCDECDYKDIGPCLNTRFADYLIANGVVVLPCKVGDTVYVVKDGKIVTMQVEFYYFGELGVHGRAKTINQNYNFKNRHIGKTVFFTREEAEKALAKRKGGE